MNFMGGGSNYTGAGQGQNQAGSNLAGMMPKEKIPKGYSKGTLNNFNPQQMQLFQQMFGQVGPESYLSRLAGGDQSMFDEMEAPAMRQFGQLQGQNAARFSNMGMGAQHGSGFQNFQNQATSDFAQDLASKRMGLQRQALMDLMGISNSLLGQQPQEHSLIKKQQKQPWWKSLLGGALPVVGAGAGALIGGPMGMAAGGMLGSAAGSAFSGNEPQQQDYSQLAGLSTNWS